MNLKKYVILILPLCIFKQSQLFAQNVGSRIILKDSCYWNSANKKNSVMYLKNKTGFVYTRFGTTIINVNGIAYQPCNLPLNLEGKKVRFSGIIFKRIKTDGRAIKLTELEII